MSLPSSSSHQWVGFWGEDLGHTLWFPSAPGRSIRSTEEPGTHCAPDSGVRIDVEVTYLGFWNVPIFNSHASEQKVFKKRTKHIILIRKNALKFWSSLFASLFGSSNEENMNIKVKGRILKNRKISTRAEEKPSFYSPLLK